jgi:hypothetical protein
MSALIINGLEIPVSAEGWQESVEEIGVRQRAYSGSALSSIRARKRAWSGSVASTDAVLIRAIRGLIAGEGYYWSFDTDLYSDGKGLPPTTFAHSLIVAGGKYENAMSLDAGKTASWCVGPWDLYTACVFAHDGDYFQHRAIVADGSATKRYVDGALVSDVGFEFGISAGLLSITVPQASDWWFDELVVTPYAWPLAWIAAMRDRTTPMRATPILAVSGDLVSPSAQCLGRVGRMSAVNLGSSILQRLEFELQEV